MIQRSEQMKKKAPKRLRFVNCNGAKMRKVISDSCEDDTAIRNLVRPILGEKETDGDSYGVPDIVTLVELVVKRIDAMAKILDGGLYHMISHSELIPFIGLKTICTANCSKCAWEKLKKEMGK